MGEPFYGERDYSFGQFMQKVRSTTNLTQVAFAQYLGVSRRTVVDWEAGNSYPKPRHLKRFIELALTQHGFDVGREAEQIRELWQLAQQKLALDESWLKGILSQFTDPTPNTPNTEIVATIIPTAPASGEPDQAPQLDLSDIPLVVNFYGRNSEMTELENWVIHENCRVVGLVGLGGMGKSALAANFAYANANNFEIVIGRSLHNAPDCQTLLEDCLHILVPERLNNASGNLEGYLALLLEQLQQRRVLLVLDNLETVLVRDLATGQIAPGYAAYARLLRQLSETPHQSCLLFTSRDKPEELIALEGSQSPVRIMQLTALDNQACQQLLAEKNVTGSALEFARVTQVYGGNPLVLKMVGQTILDLFGGQLAPFLAQDQLIFGGIRDFLDKQFERLTALEQTVLIWLAILREPATLDELLKVLTTPLSRFQLLETIETLRRRSLVERGQQQGSFTLQTVMLEFVTARLVSRFGQEVEQGNFSYLAEYNLVLAQVPDYTRQAQLRFLVEPVFEYLVDVFPTQAELEAHFLVLLKQLKTEPERAQGYAPANLVTLLQRLRGDLRGLDLAKLWLWGVSFKGIEMQDANLAGATIQASGFTETFDAITGVAVSSNGEYWAASTRSGELRLWEANGTTLRSVWQAHSERTWSIAFSPDGTLLVSGSWDGTVKLWDVPDGTLKWSNRHSGSINSVSFAPDGARLATAGAQEIIIWEVSSGTPIQNLAHLTWLTTVRWSPKGDLLATGDVVGQIYLWRINPAGLAGERQIIKAHDKMISELAFAPDGKLLASASYDSTVKVWQMADGKLHQTLSGHNARLQRVCWSPDKRTLACDGAENSILLWDVEQQRYRGTLPGHTDAIADMVFTADSKFLLSCGDSTLRIWDVARLRSVNVLEGSVQALFDVDWCPDNIHLVSGGSNKLVTIYNAVDGLPVRELKGHDGLVAGVDWSLDGTRLVSGSWDGTVRVWDATTYDNLQVLRTPHAAPAYFSGVAFSPDGTRIAGTTYLNSTGIIMWQATDGAVVWQNLANPSPTRRIAWSPDAHWLAGGGDNGKLYLWDASNGNLLQELAGHEGPIKGVTWAADNKRLIVVGGGSRGGEVSMWDILSGKQLYVLNGHPGLVYSAAWSGQADTVITGGSDGNLRWWNLASGECVATRQAHQATIQSLKTSPDGTKLVSCGDDGAIMLWDLPTGNYLKTIRRDRPYERLNITGIKGLSEAQKSDLRKLGAFEQ